MAITHARLTFLLCVSLTDTLTAPLLTQTHRLCELNVLRQVFHVATSPIVSSAWAEGQELHLYGLIYDVADGHLRKLAGPISSDDGELAVWVGLGVWVDSGGGGVVGWADKDS